MHAYTLGEQDGSRTAYLAELCSGKVVQIADAEGRTRAATVGRVKVLLSCDQAVGSWCSSTSCCFLKTLPFGDRTVG